VAEREGKVVELKTKRSRRSVDKFLSGVESGRRREDARRVRALMEEITGEKAVMWGDSIVGFGTYRYKYANGREGEWFTTGFSPRKTGLTLYIMSGFPQHQELVDRLGRYTTGKSCLYLRWLDDVDIDTLRGLIADSVAHVREGSISY